MVLKKVTTWRVSVVMDFLKKIIGDVILKGNLVIAALMLSSALD